MMLQSKQAVLLAALHSPRDFFLIVRLFLSLLGSVQ